MGNKIEILVVDDSAFMRKAITRIIESDEAFEVTATASHGLEALNMLPEYDPDVVTLDVEMPKMNGLETLKEMRKKGFDVPVVIVSSITRFGSDMSIRCLEAGAFDIVRKPESYVSMDIHNIASDLVKKLKAAADISPSRKKRRLFQTKPTPPTSDTTKAQPSPKPTPKSRVITPQRKPVKVGILGQQVITIGSSTGGPVALQKILTQLPGDIPAGIVVVQHMPPGNFIHSLSERLNSYCEIEVRVAREGDIVEDGVALIGDIGKHIVFEKWINTFKIHLTSLPRDARHFPSADVLFQSAGDVIGSRNISCILTGMGSDGAKGLSSVYANGGYSIAESEETCVVYGMPRSAVEAGVINEIAPLYKIPQVLLNVLGKKML